MTVETLFNVPRNALLDLEPGVGEVRSTIYFEVLDWQLQHVDWVHPLAAGSISARTSGDIHRTLSGFQLGDRDLLKVDEAEHRIRPWWVLEDGTRWPMGVYVFTTSNRSQFLNTDTAPPPSMAVSLMDQGFILRQDTRYPFGLPPNGSIGVAVHQILDDANITHRSIPASPTAVVADPPNWPTGTSRMKILQELCHLAGWMPPYFNNLGTLVIKEPPDMRVEFPDHVYRANRVAYHTLIEHSDALNAPNVYIVIGTGPSKAQIVASADVNPALPFSKERRHFEIVSTTRTQGLSSTEQAQKMANALASGAGSGYKNIVFTGPPDPRHDLFQTVDWAGTVYRETQWNLELRPGGKHAHTLTLGGFDGAG